MAGHTDSTTNKYNTHFSRLRHRFPLTAGIALRNKPFTPMQVCPFRRPSTAATAQAAPTSHCRDTQFLTQNAQALLRF
jgi:hypothetical protein